ncbi:MAG: hypothetical protein QM728_00020 [Gordonia sp. (in: high G+C Gram-positive bacteria)]|uniref:hypothetical protein n=1 Tax=Gordonia sp. (in: high G+C Gram-positive bacteria) TaxID=84139 RepID=UPI0039E368B9
MSATRLLAAASSLAAAACMGAGIATASPTADKPVHYAVSQTADGAAITVAGGSFTREDGNLTIRNGHGRPVAQLPLTYRVDNLARPIAATVSGDTATLTPVRAGAPRRVTPIAHDRIFGLDQVKHKASESFTQRDREALTAFSNRSTVGSFVSAAIGAALGAGSGCIIGALVGAAVTLPVAELLGAGPLAGCIAGAIVLAPAGAAAGLLFVGLPIIAFSAFQYFSTVFSPCTAEGQYCQDPATAKPKAKSAARVQRAAA